MCERYILENGVPVPCEDLLKWGDWFERADERIVKQEIVNGSQVSTVFLGIDHWFGPDEEHVPILYETMIFNAPADLEDFQVRYCTRDEALEGHAQAVKLVRSHP